MSTHVTISPTEAADRLAIRELVEAYAHCADRRDARGQMALFTADTHFVVYMNAKDPTPSHGAALARGARSSLCRSEQVRRHHALRGTEHHPHRCLATEPPAKPTASRITSRSTAANDV